MTTITLYTTRFCPFCFAAKRLLNQKGLEFDEIDVSGDPETRAVMIQRAGGRRTVPQIFVGDTHVGGFDDLNALEREGKLDPLLNAQAGAAQ